MISLNQQRIWLSGIVLCFLLFTPLYSLTPPLATRPIVQLQTSHGDIIIRLFSDETPQTCTNFLTYVNHGFYNNTLIHRVVQGFIIQGGGYTVDYIPKKTMKPIINESGSAPKNKQYTLAMALNTSLHSATSQFFINLADNPALDYSPQTKRGYTVFAEVIDGIKTLDTIERTGVKNRSIYSAYYKKTITLTHTPETNIIIYNAKQIR